MLERGDERMEKNGVLLRVDHNVVILIGYNLQKCKLSPTVTTSGPIHCSDNGFQLQRSV